MFKKVDPKQSLPRMEEEILKFWEENKIFEKSLEARAGGPLYSFYDGPPFATGLPHHGHLLASTSKDVVPRYWTMRGYYVSRRWGWDTHGLPIENIVEKKLGYKSKREVEENIEKFNEEARSTVLKFADEWRKTIKRIGRWVDFDNSYKTMDPGFMESVWWGFKKLHDNGLVYKDSRISLFCSRCSTPLSNFEIAMDNSYKQDKDVAVYVKIKIKNQKDAYLLAWTTTPWTLPAIVALAVNKNIEYVKIETEGSFYVLAEKRLEGLEGEYKVKERIKGEELLHLAYEPLFSHDNLQNGYKVVAGDFVTAENGTGIVHIAPAFGEDDFNLRKEHELPIIENVDDEGKFTEGGWKGMNVWDANFKIVGYLKEKGLLFRKENIVHSYPHCYRCDTKLIYKAQPAWFIKVSAIRDKLLEENEKINWRPSHLKHGRFGNGLETAPDWNISRSRYWGNPMPVWECDECRNVKIAGSYEELEKFSGKRLDDYHRPFIDEITFPCEQCEGTMRRILDVFDCWVESGSMPFAEFHYPFENKETFEKRYPAQFISEYIAQTRGWFYTLHVLSVGLFGKPSFINAVTTGTIAGNDGRKMSKSLGNFTDPNILLDKFGADVFRVYLMQSPLMEGENLNFSDKELEDIHRGMFRMLWNSYSFFVLYANVDKREFKKKEERRKKKEENLLDRWIISQLHMLIREVNDAMENYQLNRAARAFAPFVDDVSNWYIRRSRKRFWKSEDDSDKDQAYQTLYVVLVTLAKLLSPFAPFIAEEIYKNLTGEESVHLSDFPVADEECIDDDLVREMQDARSIINLGLSLRAAEGIKVRQPLSELKIKNKVIRKELLDVIKEEVNVKEVSVGTESPIGDSVPTETISLDDIILNTQITEELKLEGAAREIIRMIQEMRKEAGYEVDNRIKVGYDGASLAFERFGDMISKEVLAVEMKPERLGEFDLEKEFFLGKERIKIKIRRV